jgi:hypothetical protein
MTSNRTWLLKARPEGNSIAELSAALDLADAPLNAVGTGEVLVKNAFLSMDAGTRMWMTAREDGYNPPLPLGGPMVGLALGYVMESRDPGFVQGDLVRCFGQWGDHSLVNAAMSGMVRLDPDIDDIRHYFGAIGMNGWTALWGLTETAKIKPGENVLVSAAAGATGVLACQIARIMGCNVYGLAGGADKCRWLKAELGITRAIDYKSEDVTAALAEIDGGIHAYFDNVAGPILDAVLPNMALYGRIALCGLMAQYTGDGRSIGPTNFDQILMKRLTVTGFFSPDFMDQGERLTAQLRQWVEQGKLLTPFDETSGLENVVTAYAKLFSGANIGKVIVRL